MNHELLLRSTIATVLMVDPAEVSTSRDFFEQGIDSLTGLRICRSLADTLGHDVELEWVFDYPTIELLAAHLERVSNGATRTAVAAP